MMKTCRLVSLTLFSALIVSIAASNSEAQLLPSFKKKENAESAQRANPEDKAARSTASPEIAMPKLVAEVNGDKIMESDLAEECLLLHGEAELGDQIKKFLIQIECRQKSVSVTQKEINDEIAYMAKTCDFTTEDWLELLQNERGISPEQYQQDIIWPIIAIKKLAGSQMTVTEDEIQQEFNAQYGPAVKVRQIVLKSRTDADRIYAEVKANPDSFASVAKNQSVDTASQPYGGLIHPIRPGSLKNPSLEQILFSLNPGEISPVVEYPAGVFIIFRCDEHLQPMNVDIAKVRERLSMRIRDKKTRAVSENVFKTLQEQAKIDVVFGNSMRMQQLPGIAAVVNGQHLSMKFLSDVCVKRYGNRVLSDMISKLIVEQACRKQNIVITDADIDAEIREMAVKHLSLKADGSPNTELWMKMAVEENRVTPEVYKRNTIWPVLALKRLSRSMISVTDDDLQRSFEANFGKKVRCLAIAFDGADQRRAQEVWQKAHQRKTAEYFGDLAEIYSADAESRMARGVIPPIGKHCGQPVLEKEAFKLLPNEISQIIQVDNHLVILYCQGYEEPTVSDLEEVKVDLAADIFDKKQKLAVALYYENLYKQAAFDNYLTGESQNPQVEKAIRENGQTPPTQAAGSSSPVR